MNWNEIRITTVTDAVEAIHYELMELDIKGMEICDPKDILNSKADPTDWDYVDKELLENANRDEVIIKCYISEEEDLDHYLAAISKGLEEVGQFLPIGKGTIEIKGVKEEEWAHNWKKYYKPFRLGENIVIKPTWEEFNDTKESDIIIEIDPGMAFGTGTHETTSMCLELIEKYKGDNMRLLDIGCGSGILGISAAKLGMTDVIGVDIDPNAVRVARENVDHNNVTAYVDIREGNLLDVIDGEAPIIVANIIADVIIGMASIIPQFLMREGTFIASGIILDRIADVKEALGAVGLLPVEEIIKGEWAALVYTKKRD